MSVFRNPYFWVPCLIFCVNQYLERIQGLFLPFVHSYLDDLLAIPIVLGITLQAFRWMIEKNKQLVFSRNQVIVGLVYFGFLFEGLLPAWSSTYVRDPLDLLCYCIGAVYFWVFINNRGIGKLIAR